VSYTSIFNPQTAQDRNGRYLDPLEGDNCEAGLKADLMDGRLRVSGAVFCIEQNNFAVPDTGYFVPGAMDVASRAAQGAVSEGYELEAQGEVLPGWDVSVGWTSSPPKTPRAPMCRPISRDVCSTWRRNTISAAICWIA